MGGYLKIAPEHTEEGPLTQDDEARRRQPTTGSRSCSTSYSKDAGKEQYLIPYFIAAHPGTTDKDMLELALWLKQNGFRADQVQAFLPGRRWRLRPRCITRGKNPLRKVTREAKRYIPKGIKQRRLHKAFLRYHDPNNWPVLREALRRMGRRT